MTTDRDKLRLYYCHNHELALPAGHKYPIRKYQLLQDSLAVDGCFEFVASHLAPVETVKLIHDADYVDAFLAGTLPANVMRRIGFPWQDALVKRSLGSVGGTLWATRDALEHGIGGALSGGTHHAFRGEGSGFCVFNDIAVAIADLRCRRIAQRIAVLDLDVHQGDGTAKIFEYDPDVLTISVHGRNNFPFRKQLSDVDIDLPDRCEDPQFLEAAQRALRAALSFAPELIYYQSGVDGLYSDTLGRLALTHEGLRARDEMVFESIRAADIPCVITLGGGYSDPIELTVAAHANTFRTAASVFL